MTKTTSTSPLCSAWYDPSFRSALHGRWHGRRILDSGNREMQKCWPLSFLRSLPNGRWRSSTVGSGLSSSSAASGSFVTLSFISAHKTPSEDIGRSLTVLAFLQAVREAPICRIRAGGGLHKCLAAGRLRSRQSALSPLASWVLQQSFVQLGGEFHGSATQ